jgi:hypothetical protein
MVTIVTRLGKGSALTYQELDDNFTNINTVLVTASDSAEGFVELATNAEAATGTATNRALTPANLTYVLTNGPTITGGTSSAQTISDYGLTYNSHGSTGATETIDLEDGNVHGITLDSNCTLTFSNPPSSGTYGQFRLIVTQDGTGFRTITWPGSVIWNVGVEPTLSTAAGSVDVLDFYTVNAGTSWVGSLSILDAS